MAFHPPFTEEQWEAAKRDHGNLRSNLKLLRKSFPPRTPKEIEVLNLYRNLIQTFGRQLLKPHDKIDVQKMNKIEDDCLKAYLLYQAIYHLKD
jgi:hypothetical protein